MPTFAEETEILRRIAENEKLTQPYLAMRFILVPLRFVFQNKSGVHVRGEGHDLVLLWCRHEFGEPGDFNDPASRWAEPARSLAWDREVSKPIWGTVAFRDEADAMIFRLRWC